MDMATRPPVAGIDPGDSQTGKDQREERKESPFHPRVNLQASYS
jgi:hypothetical protein